MLIGVLKVAGALPVASEGEPSKVPFYIAGGVLAAWAVMLAVQGLRNSEFPRTPGAARLVMVTSGVLVLVAVSMAVATSGTPVKKSAPAGAPPPPGGGGAPGGAPGGGPPGGGASAPSTLAIAADPGGGLKYDRTSLQAKAGKVTIDFTNSSQVPHNVTIEQGGRLVGATSTITASSASVSVTLKPGSYTFFCSVDSHQQLGMQGTLTAR
jgi:plastocyanin